MSYMDPPIIVVSRPGTEIERLARIFGQDFELMFSNANRAMEAFDAGLDSVSRARLENQIRALLARSPDQSALRKEWVKLGAQYTPDDLKQSLEKLARS